MKVGIAGRIAHAFLDSKLTPLLIVASLALGALALLATPREEEPQIRVPMVDVAVAYPGAGVEDVERRVLDPIEKAMWGLSGVEHVYGTARPGFALVTVRFRVNESNEEQPGQGVRAALVGARSAARRRAAPDRHPPFHRRRALSRPHPVDGRRASRGAAPARPASWLARSRSYRTR